MAKQINTLTEIGKDLCASIGFNPTSTSTKPLYVANSLFRACTGIECKLEDVHEWVVSERRVKAKPSQDILDSYKDIIYASGDDIVDDIKEIRFFLEKLFNPDTTVFPSYPNSVLNIPSKWLVRSYVKAEANIGDYLYKILNASIEGKKSPAIRVIEDALLNDDDDYTRTIKPIIVRKAEEDRITRNDLNNDEHELTSDELTIRRGFDCLAENCIIYNSEHGGNSLLTLRRMVTYAMFAAFYHLININRASYSGVQIPLLLDAGTQMGSIEIASEACFISCKKAVEDYATNYVYDWLKEAKVIVNPDSKNSCLKYISSEMVLDKKVEDKGARAVICQHIESNCQSGDAPLLATAKALQFAIYTYLYPNTTPSDFCYYLGIKSGFVGPGGNGYKRLLVNRFFFETVVLSVISSNDLNSGIEFASLGQELRNSYNIIVGTDTDVDYSVLDDFGIAKTTPENLRGELSSNAREIANMLVSMGLAKQYADGVTLVGWRL